MEDQECSEIAERRPANDQKYKQDCYYQDPKILIKKINMVKKKNTIIILLMLITIGIIMILNVAF